MPNVQAPDGSVIAFPDDMEPAAIAGVMQKQFPAGGNYQRSAPQPAPEPRGQLEDIAKSGARGTAEGAAGLLGLPADVWHYMDRGFQNGVLWAAQKAGIMSPEGAENYRQHATAYQPNELLPTTERLTNLGSQAAKATGTYISPPQTPAGRYAETIGEFAPAAVLGGIAGGARGVVGSLARNAAIPGAASEAAGELTEGTPVEPYARIAGAVAPYGLQAAGNALRGSARGVGREISHLDPQQIQAAQTLLDESRAAGVPLSVPQAVNQASGNATRLPEIQRYVEQSPRGAPIIRQFYANQPAQNEMLAQQTLAHIANPGADLTETAFNVNQAADQTMRAADHARTQAVNPYYRAAANDQVPYRDMADYLRRIEASMAEDRTGLTNEPLQELHNRLIEHPAASGQPRMPFMDIGSLNTIRQELRDRFLSPMWQETNAVSKRSAGKALNALDDLQAIMTQHSPTFARGNQLYQDISQYAVNPLQRSMTGELANTDQFKQQARILFDPNPLPGSHPAVTQAVRNIAANDPQAARELVRGAIEHTFNNASKDLQSGANQAGGAKAATAFAANSQQARNLDAAIRALPNGQVAGDAFQRMLEIFRAQGKRLAPGSPTALNQELEQALQGNSEIARAMVHVLANSGHPVTALPNLIGRIWQDFRYGRNTEQLARIFTEGNVNDLQVLARSPANSIRARAALAALVASNEQQPQPPPPAAIDYLRQNPHLAPDFQRKYSVDPANYLGVNN